MDSVNHAAVSAEQKDKTTRGIDRHPQTQGSVTVQINGEGRLLGATECSLCTSDCDFWLLKASRWAKSSKGEFFH